MGAQEVIMGYTSFIDVIADGTYHVRISDNVLDPEDWGHNTIRIHNGKVVVSRTNVDVGAYDIPDMYGWDVEKIQEWLSHDSTGSYIETYQEIKHVRKFTDKKW
jgi:CO dehydrogenase/acetyl-CoA synthase alpha subunit